MHKEIRLQKILSEAGICSRRNAEKLILKSKVIVNGKIANLGDKATFKDEIIVDGVLISKQEKKYFLLNKPRKTICTLKDHANRDLARNLIKEEGYFFSIGRLDYNTTGAIIFTNDGDLANKLSHPKYQIERIYKAKINQKLTKEELKILNSNSVLIDSKPSYQSVELFEKQTYVVKLAQGSYHHVKKLFELVNKKVITLKRISFAGIDVKNIPLGSYRQLKPFEIKKLKLLNLNDKGKM